MSSGPDGADVALLEAAQTQTRGSQARRVLVNAGYLTIADFGGKLASLALYVVMARKLGATGFGIFTFSFTFGSLVTLPATFGQDWLLLREVSADRRRASFYLSNILGLKLALALPALGVAIAVLAWTTGGTAVAVSLVLGLAAIAQLLLNSLSAVFQSFERLGGPAAVLIGQRLVTAVIGIAAAVAGAGVLAVSLVFLITGVAALVVEAALLYRLPVTPSLSIDLGVWKSILLTALPIGVASTASLVLFRVDTILLAAFKPDREVGNYGAAYRLLETTLFLTWSVSAAVFPLFVRHSRTSQPRLGSVLERAFKLVTAFTLPLGVGAALFAPDVIHLLYDGQYARAETALRLLAGTVALYPFLFLSGELLVARKRQRPVTVTYILVAAENILANVILIPHWSLYAAAAGTTVSMLLVAASFLYFSLQETGRLDWQRIFSGPVLSMTLALAVVYAAKQWFLLALLAGGLVYGATLIVFERRKYPEDAAILINLVRRR